MCAAAVQEMREMEYIKGLPVLEDLDMSGTPLFTKNQSAAKRFFFIFWCTCLHVPSPLYISAQGQERRVREVLYASSY